MIQLYSPGGSYDPVFNEALASRYAAPAVFLFKLSDGRLAVLDTRARQLIGICDTLEEALTMPRHVDPDPVPARPAPAALAGLDLELKI